MKTSILIQKLIFKIGGHISHIQTDAYYKN